MTDVRAVVVQTRTACQILRRMGYPVRAGTLRVWVNRGRLAPAGRASDGQHEFRLGDIVDLLTRHDGRVLDINETTCNVNRG